MIQKAYVLSIAVAGLLGAATSVLANDAVKAPIRLTDAKMERIVAGATFIENEQTSVFQGYSTQPQHTPNGQGTSGITTWNELSCSGANISSCYAPGQSGGYNPTTTVTPQVSTFGPGRSPSAKIFMKQGRL